jgi:hypothetical protein
LVRDRGQTSAPQASCHAGRPPGTHEGGVIVPQVAGTGHPCTAFRSVVAAWSHGQAPTALQATPLEHLPAITGGHTRQKPVFPQPPHPFGLVGSFHKHCTSILGSSSK